MKRVLYMFALLLIVAGCDKSESVVDMTDKGSQKQVPHYYKWNKATVEKSYKEYSNIYYNSDSIVIESRHESVLEEGTFYWTEIFLSNHGLPFADVDIFSMNDSEVIAFAHEWAKEIKKETNLLDWFEALDIVGNPYEDREDFGLLWGLKPRRFSANSFGVFSRPSVSLNYNTVDYKKGYSIVYYYDGSKTEIRKQTIRVFKATSKGAGYSDTIEEFDF